MPVLLKGDDKLGAGTFTWAALSSVCRPSRRAPPGVAVASGLMTPGASPDEGAVTVNVLAADAPGATVPRETGPDGETCQPDGTPWDTDAPVSGCPVGLRSVAVTLKVPAASALAEMSASVGCGLEGGPYTSAE